MKKLMIMSQKGGSGKTTLAVHMAVCAMRHGLRTALVDIDPQRSAFKWNGSRPEGTKLDSTAIGAEKLSEALGLAEKAGFDLAVVDTAPHSDDASAIAAALADLVLIPCRPARFDLDAIASTVAIARAAKVPCLVVINAAPRGKLADEARAYFVSQGIEVADTTLHQRVAYSHAVIDGGAVHEYEPKGAAVEELEALYNHITGLLGNGVSMKKRKRVAK